jgi:hypothetical protein
MNVVNPVPVPRLSPQQWQRTAADARRAGPAVVSGALGGPALACSPEFVARSYGDVEVGVRLRDGPRRVRIGRAALGEFVATMRADAGYFAPAVPFDRLPGLLDRLDLAPLLPSPADWTGAREFARLHVGDSMRLRLHWEPTDLLLAQLHGRTHVVAEPPGSTAAHYPNAGWPTASRVDLDDPHHDTRFPLHTGEGRTATELEPGDVLHVPAGWWYEARAAGRAVWATVAHGAVLPLSDEVRERLLTLARRTA